MSDPNDITYISGRQLVVHAPLEVGENIKTDRG